MKYIYLLCVVLLSSISFAEYESSLEVSRPPIVDNLKSLNSRSDTHFVITQQSPVRSQKSRGTCTMFTAIGIVEHLLIKNGNYSSTEIDLSEEWMEYIIMKDKQSEGSSTSKNLRAILSYGVVKEATWPYLGKKWLDLIEYPIALSTCGHLKDRAALLQSCLLGHRDPTYIDLDESALHLVDSDFVTIRNEAKFLNTTLIDGLYNKRKSYRVGKTSKIKALLDSEIPLIMGTKLYYGSWNSMKTDKLEIQKRDKSKFYSGIVSYPEPGTKDRRISGELGGGHSIIIVGYDDDKVITSKMQMEDGTWKEFSYKGVYYFKNSWGWKVFGKRFELDGVNYPGYGMITQKYAHEFGTFFNILKGR